MVPGRARGGGKRPSGQCHLESGALARQMSRETAAPREQGCSVERACLPLSTARVTASGPDAGNVACFSAEPEVSSHESGAGWGLLSPVAPVTISLSQAV